MANDPYWSNTTLLLHGDTVGDPDFGSMVMGFSGAKSSAEFGTTTKGSGVALATIGGRSCFNLTNGSNSEFYVGAYGTQTAVFDGNFTLEWWYYQTGDVTYNTYGGALAGASPLYPPCSMYYISSTGDTHLGIRGGGIDFNYLPPKNQWNHHAIVVSSGVVSYYCNGVRRGFGAVNSTSYPTANGFRFGYTPSLANAGCPGYVSGARLYKGIAKYSGASFTVPAWPELPYTGLVDSSASGRTVSAIGSALTPYTADYKYGGGCMRFDGASYVSIPASTDFAFGTGDFTVEFWMKQGITWAAQAASAGLVAGSSEHWCIYKDGTVPTKLNFRSIGSDFPSASTPAQGVWEHWAFSRVGGTLRIFKNGVLDASYANTHNIPAGNPIYVGYAPTWFGYFDGNIDDLRITKGVGRYTTDFTPPAQALPEGMTTVSGTVTDATGALCSRVVRAHSRATGRLLGTAVSDPVTGVYSIGAPEQCYVVVLDSTGDYDALILDRLDPVT